MDQVVGGVLFVLTFGFFVWLAYRALRNAAERLRRRPGPGHPAPSRVPRDAAHEQEARRVREQARRLRVELGEYPSREDLEGNPAFAEAVTELRRQNLGVDALVRLARDGDRWVSRIALGALADRSDLPAYWPELAVRRLRQAPYDQAWLFLRTLERVPQPVVGPVLRQLEHVVDRDAAELIASRVADGREQVDEETFEEHLSLRDSELVAAMLDDAEDVVPFLREPFDSWRAGTVDVDFLNTFARVWARPFDAPPALLTPGRGELVDLIHQAVTANPPQPLLLVGEHGVGKTALIRAALERLPAEWLVFEATASSVNAGAIYVGELEGRVEQVVQNLRGRRIVWVLPALEETLYAGRHSQSPTGLLDHLLPHLEAGELRIVAETSPAAFETIVAQRPQAASVFEPVRVRPPGERESIAVAHHALAARADGVAASDQVLSESYELAQQFLPAAAPPGNLVNLLASTAEAVVERGGSEIDTADVLSTLAVVSGLPLTLLDPTSPLDLGAARSFFESRVLGQTEAVECLVERIAMIKAGLTDPTRPLGVFLFVGPTGTGKTEIAKTLAELLFGSPNRIIRLDMSEYQTPDSLERLLSDTSLEPQGAPLVASVRKDPFSVVLLDEFEKAAEPIWDVFLQVFDDGRLTDRHGRAVDFRRCVIILTANIGSSIASRPGLGFGRATEPFRPQSVERAVRSAFRAEFLNRIDRVVVFRPFERPQMRALLEKELAEAARRRGLRRRPWAVEYDESAIDYLIERGFSAELGARPLKRAVERYLLTPLAKAIVEQAVPEGEQFMFVTAPAGKIEVRFVDPEAEPDEAPDAVVPSREPDLRSLTLGQRPDVQAASFLIEELHRIEAAAGGEAVEGRKEAALKAVSEPGFWDAEGRFAVLADVEYLDRFSAALRTARKLGERLGARRGRNGRGASELVGFLASRLYVLDRALEGLDTGAPADVFLRIRPIANDAAEFVSTLAEMYVAWAERRGMRLEELATGEPDARVFAVSGLGAGAILAAEAGVHVLERGGDEGRASQRTAVAIEVAPWAPGPDAGLEGARERAVQAFAGGALPTQVVRRYRAAPSPLVRDAVRGYRTGRLDRVLAGDFDLF